MHVEVSPNRETPAVANGTIVFLDNTVSPQTGTVLLKTRVVNPSEALWPGQFVTVRVILTIQPDAVVVPEIAVQAGQAGAFVYLIDNGRVAIRPVEIARQIGQEVVTEVPQGLNEGSAVQIVGEQDRRPPAS
jgi:multidrug efflux system membrane fusion protein